MQCRAVRVPRRECVTAAAPGAPQPWLPPQQLAEAAVAGAPSLPQQPAVPRPAHCPSSADADKRASGLATRKACASHDTSLYSMAGFAKAPQIHDERSNTSLASGRAAPHSVSRAGALQACRSKAGLWRAWHKLPRRSLPRARLCSVRYCHCVGNHAACANCADTTTTCRTKHFVDREQLIRLSGANKKVGVHPGSALCVFISTCA